MYVFEEIGHPFKERMSLFPRIVVYCKYFHSINPVGHQIPHC